jgi:hypothetical protein
VKFKKKIIKNQHTKTPICAGGEDTTRPLILDSGQGCQMVYMGYFRGPWNGKCKYIW